MSDRNASRRRPSLLLVLALIFATSAGSATEQAGSPKALRRAAASDSRWVAQVSERWAKEWSAKNLEGVVGLYADDAVFLPSTGSRVAGKAAIRALFDQALATNTPDLHVKSRSSEQSGNLAYDSGEYDETIESAGAKRSSHGSYLVVLRRGDKGDWLIVAHMWTDTPAAGN
jgi:uncharacterized protein (TIGR02246 family)